MVDFDAIDGFHEHAVQGKPIKAYKNGIFENPKGTAALFLRVNQRYICNASVIYSASLVVG